ncbi:TonB-dependent receptor [Aurantiacibacter sediminis]|uniref:Carboxypeptidase regulatory-like domain-containing protein n=1 Tax=Aurantiacibacter sediminis TaxID=2793064 RepID=A0ABS0N5U2_9SPHN|nr:TonB-dependent receptor [Aurantiacibacter sediminis]MBH5323169.1 carboxypeptidase regulatory-like domain-containing protein [Aurantiacibacter sediminis]
MKIKYLLAASVVSLSAATAIATPAAAQETTSGITGQVSDENGNAIQDATVTVVDGRTGRTSSVQTTGTGSFNFRNLEVGGPYTVTVNASGFVGETVEGLSVNLSNTVGLSFELAAGETTLGNEIVVTATSVRSAPLALGPGSSFDLEIVQEQPSITRDIRDIISIDPRVTLDAGFPDDTGGVSCLGASERVNSLTVDGIRTDDGFGLGSSGFPSEAQPFPLDSLAAVSVEFAPFDVQYGLFSGCNINVVTKSGSNEFSGGGYFFYRDDGLQGDELEGEPLNRGDFEVEQYGVYLGGPIIEDRLFFFVNYDRVDSVLGIDDGPAGSGAPNEAQFVSVDQINQITQIVQDQYGYDAGGILTSQPRSTERFFARIDANITDDHRLALSYGRTREDFFSGVNLDAAGNEIGLSSNVYQSGNNIDTYSARLLSNWSENFSTEIRVSRLDNSDLQTSLSGSQFQNFTVVLPNGGEVQLGPDRFRQVNDLENTTDQVKVAGFLTAGNHFFTVGVEYDRFDVFNLFVQDGLGTAEFDSIADLAAGNPSDFTVRVPTGTLDDAVAEFAREIFTIYAQDEWQVTPDLLLQAGVRYDFYNGSEDPTVSDQFVARYGFTNGTGFDDLDIIQPRLGLTYDLGETFAGSTTLRGGVGVFSGGDPTVIFSNSYTNNGVNLDDVELDEIQNAGITDFLGDSVPQSVIDLAVVGDGEVNAIDPDFVIPQTIRANFAIEHQFNFGPTLILDYIYSRVNDPLFVQDLTLAQTGTAPDGRPLYRQVDFLDPDCATDPGNFATCDTRSTSDYLLTNGTSTDSHVLSVQLQDSWPQEGNFLGLGGSFSLGYAYQDVEEIQPLTSSRAVSNFGNFSKVDVNNPRVGRANASRIHNAVARLNLEKDFFEDATSQVTFFMRYRTNQPYSFNFDTSQFPCQNAAGINVFGDSRCFEDRVLLYVPAENDPSVVYGADFDLAAFNSYLTATGLDEYRGQIVERNAFDAGDYWDLDISFQQEIPGFFARDRFTLRMDIQNALNLIDSDWNILRDASFEYNVPIVGATINDAGQYVFEEFTDPSRDGRPVPLSRNTSASLWSIQFGIRYEF